MVIYSDLRWIRHCFIPHNAYKMLEARVIKEFDLYELRAELPPPPPSVKGKGAAAPGAPVVPAPLTLTTR